jgi:membrane-bound serine protease (ClpP class)
MVILGIVLVLAGAGLLVAEAHLPTYGLLGLVGVVTLVAGGAIAVDGSGGGLALVLTVSLVLALIAGTALALAARGVARVSHRRSRTGTETLIGHVGVVRNGLEPVGQVFVDGALWRARPCVEDEPDHLREGEPDHLREGDPVVVERVQGLTLSVRRAEEWELEL